MERKSNIKLCPGCGIDKHVLCFSLSRESKDGLFYRCRECYNGYQRRSRWEKRVKRLGGADGEAWGDSYLSESAAHGDGGDIYDIAMQLGNRIHRGLPLTHRKTRGEFA